MYVCSLFTCLSLACLWSSSEAQLKAGAVFECDFRNDACGLVNEENAVARWERKLMNVGGRSGMVMSVATEGKKKQTARLLTPYIDEHWRNAQGCLSFELFTAGDGVASFRVRRQDDSGFFPLIGVHTQVSKWRKYNVNVDVDDYVRFIFEAHVNPSQGGTTVALANISFKLEECVGG